MKACQTSLRGALVAALAALAAATAGCSRQDTAEAPQQAPAAAAPAAVPAERPELTIKDIMDSMVDPSGDFLFESVQDISDDTGVHRKEPRTDAEWAEVRRHIAVLQDAPRLMVMEGRRSARPEDRSTNPAVENQPEEVQHLMDTEHDVFVARAKGLQDAAVVAMKAADAKDVAALETALVGIDHACESCHLHFWYPNDRRAQQAAIEEGVTN